MYNGVINVYKEPGFTSFDVVAKLRGILKQKKIGHTGTLDPDAEGVLVVCLGKATKLCELLTNKDKSYVATLRLGQTSDTEDASGTILTQKEVTATKEEVLHAIMSFVGSYEQIPPMYSAIKINGKKLYELARMGTVVERTPRKVTIHSIEVIKMELPYVTFRVSCGKGTYIRSLCRDIGEKLGCGGLMEHLVRDCVISEETGKSFDRKDAFSLAQIEQMVRTGEFESHILGIDELFPTLHKLYVTPEGDKKLQNGNFLLWEDFKTIKEEQIKTDFGDGMKFLIYTTENTFRAIYRYDEKKHCLKVDKMF